MTTQRQNRKASHREPSDFTDHIWKVIAGRPVRDQPDPPPQYYIQIVLHPLDGEYVLAYKEEKEVEWHELQRLVYEETTHTLENKDGDRERCIAFWGRKNRNRADKNSIFAMRIKKQDAVFPDLVLPWEKKGYYVVDGDDGTWGAEEG